MKYIYPKQVIFCTRGSFQLQVDLMVFEIKVCYNLLFIDLRLLLEVKSFTLICF